MLHSDSLSQSVATSAKIGSGYRPLSYIEAAQLEAALLSDASSLAQVALVSLFEGISGVANNRFSWSTVKLDYSAFYAIRSLLMMKRYSIFYVGRTPYTYLAAAGQIPARKSGNSHTVAFNLFKDIFKNDVSLSQEIDHLDPLNWIENKRNYVSYRAAPYLDPLPPDHFSIIGTKIRNNIVEYMTNKQYIYTFDKDHAMIAYPILLLSRATEEIKSSNPNTRIIVDKHIVDIVSSVNCFVPALKSLDVFDFG